MPLQYTNQVYELAQDIIAGSTITTLDISSAETPVASNVFVLKVGLGDNAEWIVCSGLTSQGGGVYRTTVLARGLDKDASSITDVSTSNERTLSKTTTCKVVTHSYDWVLKGSKTANNTFSGDNTITGTQTFQSTSKVTIVPQQVTTTERDALIGVVDGTEIYNTTTGTGQLYQNGTWTDVPTGSTNNNASETVQGKVRLGTVQDQIDGAAGTLTDSAVILQPQHLKMTPATDQTDDEGKVTMMSADGRIRRSFFQGSGIKFGGDGSDGVLSGNVSISDADNSYLVRNYRSITAGAYTISTTATNCIIHIKVLGDADMTGWTIDVKGKGAQPGTQDGTTSAGGVRTNATAQTGFTGADGVIANATCPRIKTTPGAGTGGSSGAGGTGGTAATSPAFSLSYGLSPHMIIAGCGQAGGGGGGGYNITTASGSVPPFTAYGGSGGAGGGCVILEVAGTVTFSGTTVDIRGNNGSNGSAGSGSGSTGYCASGGGGGGAGGTFICLYGEGISGSPTVNATAGSAGSAGATAATGGGGGGGGAGGSNIFATGSNGSSGNASGVAGAGGAGAAGSSLIAANTIYT